MAVATVEEGRSGRSGIPNTGTIEGANRLESDLPAVRPLVCLLRSQGSRHGWVGCLWVESVDSFWVGCQATLQLCVVMILVVWVAGGWGSLRS